MTAPAKTAVKQDRRFKKGVSGNPAGRPEGSRNKATLAIQALLDGEAEKLTRKAITMALAGDVTALRLCMDRIAPPRRDSPISLALPAIKTAGDAVAAMTAIVSAVAAGEISPAEADALAALVEKITRAIETADLAERVAELEAKTWSQI